MKTKIEEIVKIANELNDQLIGEWMNEKNPTRANQLLADVNRMKYITSKCEEILKRGKKEEKKEAEETPLEDAIKNGGKITK